MPLPRNYNFRKGIRQLCKRGTPASFPLNRVIAGWTEALQLMPVGSKWRLIIPPHLAYGDQQISKEIGPNSTLVFEVELLDIK